MFTCCRAAVKGFPHIETSARLLLKGNPANDNVVNKQTESHKGLIFYLHEVKLVYNDYHPSPPPLLSLSCYLSGFFGVLPRLQKSTHPTRV